MGFTESSNNGSLSGTSEVTIVAAPGVGRRIVKTIQIQNQDTAAVRARVILKDTAGSSSYIWDGILDSGDTWEYGEIGEVTVLDATTKSVVASLAFAVTSTNPTFIASYADAT